MREFLQLKKISTNKRGAKMKKLILVILFLSSNLFSQTAFEFLKLDASARSAALGGAFVSNVDDPNSIFYNPASLQFVDPNNVSFGFLKHLLDVNSGFASYTTQFKGLGKFGFAAMYTNYGSFDQLDEFGNSLGTFSANDVGLIGNYSGLVRENLSYGVNIKFIYSSIYNVSAVALAGDFGLLYFNKEKQFSAGLSILNVGSQLKTYYNSKEKLPVDVRLGFSKKLEHTPFRLYLEFTKLNQTEKGIFSGFNNFILGGEIYTSSALTFRFGFNNEKRKEFKVGTTAGTEGFNLGIGINLSGYKFDYALSSFGKIGSLHRINISTSF
jgi:hypothetical protein